MQGESFLGRWRGDEDIKAEAVEEVGGGEETKASEWCCRLVEWERWGRATTIAVAPGSSRAFIVDVGKATQRAMESRAAVFLRVSKAPTVSALARWRNIRLDGERIAPNVDMSRKFVALKGGPSNIVVEFFWRSRGDKV